MVTMAVWVGVIWGVFAATWIFPTGGTAGPYAWAAGRGWTAVGWSTVPVGVSYPASSSWPMWHMPSAARLMLAPTAAWRPSGSSAGMTVAGPGGLALTTLDTFWVPLWWPGVLLTGLAAWLAWRATRLVPAGHCTACGYDRRGAAGSRCPECGVG